MRACLHVRVCMGVCVYCHCQEILRKTELSSLLEDSRQHVIALEVLIEKWQEEVCVGLCQLCLRPNV